MIYIGMGSNCGDREEYLRRAEEALRAGLSDCVFSSIHESEALLPEGADTAWNMPFLNRVMGGKTKREPLAVLHWLKQIERDLGRQPRGHWGPREIDLDLLLYDDLVMQSEVLTLPHPEMHKRDFVMLPLAEIKG